MSGTGVFLAKVEPTVMQAERGDRAQVRFTVDRMRTTEPNFRPTVRTIRHPPNIVQSYSNLFLHLL